MTKRCLDEAVLQAFMDGELEPGRAAEAASHLAACGACAAALAEAEQASTLFAAAFAPDETVAVPTEILRSRINAAVARLEEAQEPSRRPSRVCGGFFASLAGLFGSAPQPAAAFAGLLAVLALAAVYFAVQRSRQATPPAAPVVARMEVSPERRPAAASPAATRGQASEPTPDASPAVSFDAVKASATSASGAKRAQRRAAGGGARPRVPTPAPAEEALPGERAYQTAIASLEKTIELGGDTSLKPSLRVEYERNLALLDSAITQTREVAAQNPKDKDAVGFLMSAYQSKVELLTKVADQAQVSALGR
ncbi:MAG TPA: zf-HC2 domain-containing protein [Pyrinomonadaceae bacterium]|jgi:anti-sigma factor RsiW